MWELAHQVISIARQAGDMIMRFYDDDYQVDLKDDCSPVTEADRAAHVIIYDGLLKLPRHFPILSEEDMSGFRGVGLDGYYWLVDPLDGTKEYIKRNGEFSVNIALICKGKPVLGVIHAPAIKVSYFGVNGLGAYKITEKRGLEKLSGKNRVSTNCALRVVGSRSHHSIDLMVWLERQGKYQLQHLGSSLKFCLIAEGSADVYPRFGPTCLWDSAAGEVIVSEAGGVVSNVSGEHLNYDPVAPYLNPSFIVWGHRS